MVRWSNLLFRIGAWFLWLDSVYSVVAAFRCLRRGAPVPEWRQHMLMIDAGLAVVLVVTWLWARRRGERLRWI